MHISLPPSAYIMKVKLPRLKEEPKPDAEASGEFRDGAQLAETEMGSERRSVYQAQVESFLEDGVQVKIDQISMWVCLKIGYIPNYSHLIGIMIINHWV